MSRLITVGIFVIVGVCGSRTTWAAGWQLESGLGYGVAWPLSGAVEGPAHAPHGRLRLSWLPGQRLGVSCELLIPLAPLPWGQVGAGLSLGSAWPLHSQIVGTPRTEWFESAIDLSATVGGGWLYVNSGLSEGYLSVARYAMSYHGPYARAETGVQWAIRPLAPVTRLREVAAGVVAGAMLVHARYRVPAAASGYRLGPYVLLVVGLGW